MTVFLDFFYFLRTAGIKATPQEYLDLLTALDGLLDRGAELTRQRLYQVLKHCLVKDIRHYDTFELCFGIYFRRLDELHVDWNKLLNDWLKSNGRPKAPKLPPAHVPPADLLKELMERFEKQKKRHAGGNYWIGTGGSSPFGNSGFNPGGLRIGGAGQGRSAMAVLGERRYQDYRTDELLEVRQLKVALKKLRDLKKTGEYQLEINKTIKKTCDNGGEIELIHDRDRKNSMKLLLLMDVGGSMDPHARRVEKLFSAAHQMNHFKEFKSYYFHNIFYGNLYKNSYFSSEQKVSFKSLYQRYDKETRVIILGDAYMAPYEMFQMTGSMRDYYDYLRQEDLAGEDHKTGQEWLLNFREHFPKTVWLNPERQGLWREPTISAVKEIVPMFYLSVEGLESAIKELK